MRTTTFVTALFTAALILAPLAGFAQGQQRGGNAQAQQRAQVERGQRDIGRDRLRDRDRISVPQHDRDRIQDRTKAPENAQQDEHNIYGYNLMNEEERIAYRERVKSAESRQEREQIEAQHRHEMQTRARNEGVQIEDTKKAQKGKNKD